MRTRNPTRSSLHRHTEGQNTHSFLGKLYVSVTDEAPPSPPPAPTAPPAGDEPAHVLLHVPVNVRSMTLIVLAVLAVLATLKWASAFFIPLMVSLMFSYALSPVVDAL